MNHSEAIESQAVAAYLLEDLSDEDRSAFEMHYIDCPVCAEAVYTGTKMFAVRVDPLPVPGPVPQPLPVPLPFPRRVQQWMSVAAAAISAFVLGVLINPVPKPSVFVFAEFAGAVNGVVRGAADEPIVVHFEGNRQKEIVISNFPVDPDYETYEVALQYASGELLHAERLPRKRALVEEGVPMLLNPLPVGRYVLETRGVRKDGNRSEPFRKSVVVQ